MWTSIAPLAAVLAPLLLIAAALTLPRSLALAKFQVRVTAVLALALVTLAAVGVVFGGASSLTLVSLGELSGVPLGLSVRLDALSASVALLVTGLGALLVGYSIRYMDGDPSQRRFLRGLLATLAAVVLLVLAGNFLLLVLAWIATSLTLHGLLTFYRERPGALLAARKKFLFSRVSEVCLVAAAVLVARAFGSLEFAVILERSRELAGLGQSLPELPWIAGLVVTAVLIKCAQFPFHGWLPEVMETPTPVSALLHAGIINAGGFLVLRLSPLLELAPGSLDALLILGAVTALFAGAVMTTQNSVKVVLAWSTCAQMGFMLMQCGLSAFSTAALHLFAHSLYKAHAFLSAGGGVDERRREGPRSARPQVGSRLRVVWLALALALGLSAAAALGIDPGSAPGKSALVAILSLGLATLVLEARNGRERLPIALAGVGLAVVYFALAEGTGLMLGDSVAADRKALVASDLVLPALVALAFGLAFFLHGQLPDAGKRWKKAYVALHCGLWVNAYWDRLIQRLWPLPADPGPASVLASAAALPKQPGPQAGQSVLPADLSPAIHRALGRISPLWTLDRFVAVNPYFGFAAQTFEQTAEELERVRGIRSTLARSEYKQRLQSGRIQTADLLAALAASGSELTLTELHAALETRETTPPAQILTLAETRDAVTGSRAHEAMVREIGRWTSAYLDQEQATWAMPWQDQPLFPAWRAAVRLGRMPTRMGFPGLRAYWNQMPLDPAGAIRAALETLALPVEALDDYLHAAAGSIAGWLALGQHYAFEAGLKGGQDDRPLALLAMRLSWDAALLHTAPEAVRVAWQSALAAGVAARRAGRARRLEIDLVLQKAHEFATQRWLLAGFERAAKAPAPAVPAGHEAHAVFCIDVRSEVYRRHLEHGGEGQLTTSGFAGFFGLALAYGRQGDRELTPQCPVLLNPRMVLEESSGGSPARAEARQERRDRRSAWHGFRTSGIGGFAFVETVGLSYAARLWKGGRALGQNEPGAVPSLAPRATGAGHRGLDLEARIELAAGILGAMSLPVTLPRLVLLAGHGGQSANNAHAAGLDCGACGGQNGAANARAAVVLLNDPEVRAGLAQRGRAVPETVRFVAGLHDTTTDRVELYDLESLPASHGEDIQRLRRRLAEAGQQARLERATRLGLAGKSGADIHAALFERATDWAQVRPEWALAGNMAFVAAPRARTRAIDLQGRSFLHEYDWHRDEGFGVLELILTAPLVVANWINLQYFGSSVDNRYLGSGNKVLHNVVGGTLGVLEGSGGDLRPGLSWQSVHDGQAFAHEPLRLTAFIEAPAEAIDRVLAKHEHVRHLVEHGWLHLLRLEGTNGRAWRRLAGGRWEPAEAALSSRQGQVPSRTHEDEPADATAS